MSVLVAAIGSAHGADCLGWDVADHMLGSSQFSFCAEHDLCIKKYRHPTAAIYELADFSHAIFVDAIESEQHPYGELLKIDATDLQPGNGMVSCHSAGLSDALCLAHSIGTLPSDCIVMGLNVYPLENTRITEIQQTPLIHEVWAHVLVHLPRIAM